MGGGERQIVAWWRVQHLSSNKNAILLSLSNRAFLSKGIWSCTAGAASKTGRWGSNNPQLCSSWRKNIIFKLAATCLMRNWTGPRSPVRIICHLYLLCSYPLMESMALRTVRGWVHYSPLSDAPPHLLLGSAVCSQSLLKSYICTLLVQAETFLMCIALICGAAAHSWSCLCSCLYSEPDPAILAKPPPLSPPCPLSPPSIYNQLKITDRTLDHYLTLQPRSALPMYKGFTWILLSSRNELTEWKIARLSTDGMKWFLTVLHSNVSFAGSQISIRAGQITTGLHPVLHHDQEWLCHWIVFLPWYCSLVRTSLSLTWVTCYLQE